MPIRTVIDVRVRVTRRLGDLQGGVNRDHFVHEGVDELIEDIVASGREM